MEDCRAGPFPETSAYPLHKSTAITQANLAVHVTIEMNQNSANPHVREQGTIL